MKLVKPNKIEGEVKQIMVPKLIDNAISLLPHLVGESMGFFYGVKTEEKVYIGSASQKPRIGEQPNPVSEGLKGKNGREYVKIHNEICKRGKKISPDFIQIVYHSHPRLSLYDISKEQLKKLHSQFPEDFPEFQNESSRLVKLLDNTQLSEEDKNFITQYSSGGLGILSVGEEKDIRNEPRKDYSDKFDERSLDYLFSRKKSRLKGFEVTPAGVWEIPVAIAEESDNYQDEQICTNIVRLMDPLNELSFKYCEKVLGQESMKKFDDDIENYLDNFGIDPASLGDWDY